MATARPGDAVHLAFFQSLPHRRDRLASIIGAIGDLMAELGVADAADQRLVEELCLLGRKALKG